MQQVMSTCSLYLTSHESFEPTFAPLVYLFAPKVYQGMQGCVRIDDGDIHLAHRSVEGLYRDLVILEV